MGIVERGFDLVKGGEVINLCSSIQFEHANLVSGLNLVLEKMLIICGQQVSFSLDYDIYCCIYHLIYQYTHFLKLTSSILKILFLWF